MVVPLNPLAPFELKVLLCLVQFALSFLPLPLEPGEEEERGRVPRLCSPVIGDFRVLGWERERCWSYWANIRSHDHGGRHWRALTADSVLSALQIPWPAWVRRVVVSGFPCRPVALYL